MTGPCACAHKSQHVLGYVSSSCKEGRQCHEDELRQPPLTLGVVIPSGNAALTSFQCCAPVLFSHVQRLTFCRLAEQKVTAEELPWWIVKGHTLESVKAPRPRLFLPKLKFETLKCLNLFLWPLKSESNRKKCILMLPSLRFRMSWESMSLQSSHFWYDYQNSQTWKCLVLKVWSSTEIAVLSFWCATWQYIVMLCGVFSRETSISCSNGAGGKKKATDYCAYFPPEDQCWMF